MFQRWTIRKKLQMAMVVLGIVIAILGYSSFRGGYAYKKLATTLSSRASEIPLTSELTRVIDELRIGLRRREKQNSLLFFSTEPSLADESSRFLDRVQDVRQVLARYRSRLDHSDGEAHFLSDRSEELAQAKEISTLLSEIVERHQSGTSEATPLSWLEHERDLEQLSELAHELPSLLTHRMASFRDEVRTQYRTWIVMTWSSAILAGVLLVGLIAYARTAVVRPFKELLFGARRVASGDFSYRIQANTKDELAELAHAINLGAQSFLAIQNDLNEQVRQRSEEVIRNEQLASVGFLAAGVAHEINNPLASIAWSAEALESRVHRMLHTSEANTVSGSHAEGIGAVATPESSPGTDIQTLKTYLRRIQDEAFRCKGITERLLDFSRLGNAQRKQQADLNEIVEDVVDMVRHLGQFRSQRIDFTPTVEPLFVWASPQEMKQVVLNLLTNALESLDLDTPGGLVSVSLEDLGESVRMSVEDNGCGMTDEVVKHLFEPFFTRRRDGRGTGLGLSITSRIIADHGGRIKTKSQGPGHGSRFEVTIPSKPTNDSLYDQSHQRAVA
jgi:signal transduction histidine kinase